MRRGLSDNHWIISTPDDVSCDNKRGVILTPPQEALRALDKPMRRAHATVWPPKGNSLSANVMPMVPVSFDVPAMEDCVSILRLQ